MTAHDVCLGEWRGCFDWNAVNPFSGLCRLEPGCIAVCCQRPVASWSASLVGQWRRIRTFATLLVCPLRSESDRISASHELPLCAKSDLTRRSKKRRYCCTDAT